MNRLPLLFTIIFLPFNHTWAQPPAFDIKSFSVTWEVIENNHQGKGQCLSAFTFTNTSKVKFPSSGWNLYFNFARNISHAMSTGVKIESMNGDLYKLSPTAEFPGIEAGKSYRIEFLASDWVVNYTDAPAGLYILWNDNKPSMVSSYTIKPSTEPKQYLRFPGDKIGLITPEIIFNQNSVIQDIPLHRLPKIFPAPADYREMNGQFIVTSSTAIVTDPSFKQEAGYLTNSLSELLSGKPSVNTTPSSGTKNISLVRKDMPAEAYELSVTTDGVIISASDGAGIFYGIQSMLTLFPPDTWKTRTASVTVPAVKVRDSPRFGFRSFFLDVARNFQTKDQIKKLLDLMALYKLNVLHFHLNEDEGWRLEIPSLPELTQIGSKRGHTTDNKMHLQPSYGSGPDVKNPFGTGYYTKSDFVELLRYASDRHIRIIPEIETPGHARAAVQSMKIRYERLMEEGKKDEAERYMLHDPHDKSVYRSVQGWNDNVINVALPSTYTFLEKVTDEIIAMYREADAPLASIHFGGDEVPSGVWEKSPVVDKLMTENPAIRSTDDLWYYYYGKIDDMLKKRGLFLSGWEEIAMRKTMLDGNRHMIPNPDFADDHFQVNVWNNVLGWGAEDLAYKLANAGYKVVLSCVSNLYFDMAYYKDFDEPGYYWGSFTDVDKPFYFIPYDYFKNSKEDRYGNALDRSIFIGKERLTDYGKTNIVGIQGLLWSETIQGPKSMEYKLLPKLLGLAERAWAADPAWATEKDPAKADQLYAEAWSDFANTIGKRELIRLDYFKGGFNYRIPSPGAVVENGKVVVNMQLPGFTVRYTSDGKEPTVKSKVYTSPIADKGTITLKAFNVKGRRGRSTVVINGK